MSTEHKSNTPADIKDLWQTPQSLFDKLNDEFNFTCDVAASDENRLCPDWLNEEDDALKFGQAWGGSNWCNPPYSNIKPWVEAAALHHKQGSTTVMLVPSDTSVKWFKMAFESCNEVRFISGRISFINAATKKPVNGNNKGSVLFIWRGHCPSSSKCVTLIDRDQLV
ncbi:MAG: phage N-6-adenine-methyltransferase [Immundisolibacteraceae bacterium]|nr:phage N-6-adenine-methyltransferase [Immundisolibacteraceae bacterium]